MFCLANQHELQKARLIKSVNHQTHVFVDYCLQRKCSINVDNAFICVSRYVMCNNVRLKVQ